MNRPTQSSEVLKYLQTHDGLTSMEAFELFGVTRLASIIYQLRRRGYKIETYDMEGINRYGGAVRYAKYLYRGSVRTSKHSKRKHSNRGEE